MRSWLAVTAVLFAAGCPTVSGLSDFVAGEGGGVAAGGAGATGGDGGAGGATSATGGMGGMGGGAMGLVDDGLLVRFFLDDQPPGPTVAGTVQDSGPGMDPLDLAPDPNMTWRLEAGNRGLHWTVPSAGGMASLPIFETMANEVDDRAEITIEVVAGPLVGSTDFARLVHIGADTSRVSLGFDPGLELRANPDGSTTASWGDITALTERTVLQVVITLDGDVPVQLYVDGAPDTSSAALSSPPSVLDISGGSSLVIGNRPNGDRSPQGFIGYVALYDKALSPDQLAQNAARLLVSDDR